MLAAAAEALWAAALVVGFALGFRAWGDDVALWLGFGQGLPVVIGAVALAHVASLAAGAPVVQLSRREMLSLLVLIPIGALLIGALLALGQSIELPLIRIASFAIYRRRDPDPPAEVADAFHLGAAVVLAPILAAVFIFALTLLVRFLAPALRAVGARLTLVHFTAALWVPVVVLLGVAAAVQVIPRALAYVVSAGVSAGMLAVFAHRALASESPEPTPATVTVGAVVLALLGHLAALWAALP